MSKANGVRVRSKEELHAALQLQPAFTKLEVLNRDGNVKFAQRARYAGEHHQLGLILAPDEDAEYVAAPRSSSLRQGLRLAGARLRGKGARRSYGGSEEAAASESGPPPEEAGGRGEWRAGFDRRKAGLGGDKTRRRDGRPGFRGLRRRPQSSPCPKDCLRAAGGANRDRGRLRPTFIRDRV
ncbi:hypothetical protein [Cohnella rhizosphaerae]|uniref:Uncharacterized protein n=1 Tax=Cohnella rhizosphaerae TaxID=1457232 RepID=A0A9X4L1N6_9BACL|nr:hypothetical protein [Cohnella rhizosphaerae]MDG0811929.1 hypothetical protein [Cohnella rhizosphaerae]